MSRDAPGGTWVPEWVPGPQGPQTDRYFEDSDPALLRLRRALPLNGETAYADTAAAFAALPRAEQARLSRIQVRRHSYNRNDEAALAPLVRTNPRSGIKSLHSPLWCPRPPTQIPVEVDGMSAEASQALLEEVEAHVLQPEFRYDHAHTPGDVTLWDLFMTIHVSPPMKENIPVDRRCPPVLPHQLQGRTGVDAAPARPARVDQGAHFPGIHDTEGSDPGLTHPSPRGAG